MIGMPVFMDDIAAIGGAEDIRKGIRNCRKMEIEKTIEYGLTKTNIVVIKTRKGIAEKIEEEVRAGKVKKTDKIRYLGMAIDSEGNLKDHIRQVETKSRNISKEIKVLRSKIQVGPEEMKVKIKLFETCLMPATIHGLEKNMKYSGIWPIKERTEYSTMMLFHSVMNSDDERISKKIIEQQ